MPQLFAVHQGPGHSLRLRVHDEQRDLENSDLQVGRGLHDTHRWVPQEEWVEIGTRSLGILQPLHQESTTT